MMATKNYNSDIQDYLLGWMSARERRRMDQRIANDSALQTSVKDLQSCLEPLNALVDPVTPPDETWGLILARLNGKTIKTKFPILTWAWGISGGLAVIAIVVVILSEQPKVLYQARLNAAAGSSEVAEIDVTNQNDLIIRNKGLPIVSPNQNLELWIIPAGAKPQSAGVIQPGKTNKIHVASLPAHATLAISVEPLGGSPTGSPTGPVIVSGELQAL